MSLGSTNLLVLVLGGLGTGLGRLDLLAENGELLLRRSEIAADMRDCGNYEPP